MTWKGESRDGKSGNSHLQWSKGETVRVRNRAEEVEDRLPVLDLLKMGGERERRLQEAVMTHLSGRGQFLGPVLR